MKKSLFFAFLIAGAAGLFACGGEEPNNGGEWVPPAPIPNENAIDLPNHNFEDGLEHWTIKNWSNGEKTTVEVVDGEGRGNSKAAKIQQWPENGKCCVALERKLTGLEPDMLYRASVSIRYSDLSDGCGAILFAGDDRQHWNSSKFTSGTKLDNWTIISFDFLSDDNGEATIYLALGFKWDSYPNIGGRSTGTVYFDNVSVVKVTDEMYCRESKHIRFFCYPNKVTAGGTYIDKWLKEVDGMYEAYHDLVGTTPHQGRKLVILTTQGMYYGYWALAGYPILWGANGTAPEDHFAELKAEGTISFGLMHEIGHVFNVNGSNVDAEGGKQYYSNWNWNDEMFANFRMHYGLEMVGAKVRMTANGASESRLYVGGDILDMYKADYEQTLPKGKFNDNAIHYLLANLTKSIGWEPFKRTFREITTKPCPYSNKYDKFKYFVKTLSKHASDVHGTSYDILNDMISESERKAVEAQLK